MLSKTYILFFFYFMLDVNKMPNISKKGQNSPKLSKIHMNSNNDRWIYVFDSNNFSNVFSCLKVDIFPNRIIEFRSLWLCSLQSVLLLDLTKALIMGVIVGGDEIMICCFALVNSHCQLNRIAWLWLFALLMRLF